MGVGKNYITNSFMICTGHQIYNDFNIMGHVVGLAEIKNTYKTVAGKL
jgi:ABC-type tungstate transport system permease subunit